MDIDEIKDYGNIGIVIASVLAIAIIGIVFGVFYFMMSSVQTGLEGVNCEIEGNTIVGSTGNAIVLYADDLCVVEKNIIHRCYTDAIGFERINNTIISNNEIYACSSGIDGREAINCTFSNNIIHNNSREGFGMNRISGCMISNNIINNTLMDGISLMLVNDSFFLNNVISNTDGFGMFLVRGSIVANNTILGGGGGIHISIGFDVILSNNIVRFTSASGITASECVNCTIMSNVIYKTYDNGIELPSSQDCLIFNNTVTSCQGDGIYLWSTKNSTISSNSVSGNTYSGIAIFEHSHYSIIIYNNITNNKLYGIFIENSRGCKIYGNRVGWNSDDNARDNGLENQWDDGLSVGNTWSDYDGNGTYLILGSAGSIDYYPSILIMPTTTSSTALDHTSSPLINILVSLTIVAAGIVILTLFIKRKL